jgi:hypothetical protein
MRRNTTEQLAHLVRLGERYELSWELPKDWQKQVTRSADCAYERNYLRMKLGFASLDEVVEQTTKTIGRKRERRS